MQAEAERLQLAIASLTGQLADIQAKLSAGSAVLAKAAAEYPDLLMRPDDQASALAQAAISSKLLVQDRQLSDFRLVRLYLSWAVCLSYQTVMIC